MKTDWQKLLTQFYGKKCRVAWNYKNCNLPKPGRRENEVYIFDDEKEGDNGLFENIIGDWDVVKRTIGKGGDVLVMFGTETYDEDPFAMVEVIYFYDQVTGEIYVYEDGSFDKISFDTKSPPYRLDQLEITAE